MLGTASFVDVAQLADGLQYVVPTTGSTVTVQCVGQRTFVDMEPAGTLATLTVTLPANPPPAASVALYTTQQLTSLTVNAATGSSVGGNVLSIMTQYTSAEFFYNNVTATWNRFR